MLKFVSEVHYIPCAWVSQICLKFVQVECLPLTSAHLKIHLQLLFHPPTSTWNNTSSNSKPLANWTPEAFVQSKAFHYGVSLESKQNTRLGASKTGGMTQKASKNLPKKLSDVDGRSLNIPYINKVSYLSSDLPTKFWGTFPPYDQMSAIKLCPMAYPPPSPTPGWPTLQPR